MDSWTPNPKESDPVHLRIILRIYLCDKFSSDLVHCSENH